MEEPILQVGVLYIFYLVIALLIFLFVKKYIKRGIALAILVTVIFAPFLLYLPVETKTALYGSQFSYILDEGIESDLSVVYYKVFGFSKTSAKLYVVEGENGQHEVGSYYRFVFKEGAWKVNPMGRTLWTNLGGSASEFCFPPYF